MTNTSSCEKLEKKLKDVCQEKDKMALMLKAVHAIPTATSFEHSARFIYDICKSLIGATCGYVALLSEDESQNEILFLDDGGLPCSVDPNLPMPIQGLRATAYASGKSVYENYFMESDWLELMPQGHVRLDNVMFSPLTIGKKTVGVLGLANKVGGFTTQDKKTAQSFADIATLALKHGNIYDEIKEKEKLHREIIESISDAVLITDDTGNFTYICPNTKLIFGIGSEALASRKNISSLFRKEIFNRSELEKKKEICNIPVQISDYVGKTHHLLVNVKIVEIGHGSILYTCRDISNRKQVEKKLEQSEQKFRNIVNVLPQFVAYTDKNLKYRFINETYEKKFGIQSQDIINKTLQELIGKDAFKTAKPHIENVFKGKRVNYTERFNYPTGESLDIDGTLIPDIDDNGNVNGYFAVLTDITQHIRKQTELQEHTDKLEQMNTALNVLINHRDDEKKKRENEIIENFKKLIFPYFDLSINDKSRGEISLIFNILNRNIKEILFQGNKSINAISSDFTPLEIQVANLIRESKSTKEIANILQTSVRAIYFHRENIRKKLNLTGDKINLKSFLQTRR